MSNDAGKPNMVTVIDFCNNYSNLVKNHDDDEVLGINTQLEQVEQKIGSEILEPENKNNSEHFAITGSWEIRWQINLGYWAQKRVYQIYQKRKQDI